MANEYYSLTVAGLQRQLPICPLNDKLSIAGFIMFSDVELTIACAEELLKTICPFEIVANFFCCSVLVEHIAK